MEEDEGTQVCPNCNREIPKGNFVIHSVHCVRNIKICPVCKEPVPQSELEDHTDRLHLLVPCTKCGEQVRGTDMEDHIRDSCAFTMQTCRYCTLELRRREVPGHERYCGARTERCADCGEYVMLRYRQLHLESNHGFVRLREDSPPRFMRDMASRPATERRPTFPPPVPLTDLVGPDLSQAESLRRIAEVRTQRANTEDDRELSDEELRRRIVDSVGIHFPRRARDYVEQPPRSHVEEKKRVIASLRGRPGDLDDGEAGEFLGMVHQHRQGPERRHPFQWRDAENAQAIPALHAVMREMLVNHAPEAGAGEAGQNAARDAPAPEEGLADPVRADPEPEEGVIEVPQQRPTNAARTRSNYRVILKRTNDQPQINTAVTGQDKAVKNLGARGAVKKRPAPPAPLPPPDPRRDLPYFSALQRRQDEDRRREEQTAHNLAIGLPPVLDPAAKLEKLRRMDALHRRELEEPPPDSLETRVWYSRNNNHAPIGHALGRGATNINAASNSTDGVSTPTMSAAVRAVSAAGLQPMSAEEFRARFNRMQLQRAPPSDIRSSLRELRRGLNEVTAPYNNSASTNNNNNINKNNNIIEDKFNELTNEMLQDFQLNEARAPTAADRSPEGDVMVPCEFCSELLRVRDIFDHETACGRGLTDSPTPPITPTPSSRPPSPWDEDIPVIPCEFCTEALPFYLINEHQALCGRESNLLYPD